MNYNEFLDMFKGISFTDMFFILYKLNEASLGEEKLKNIALNEINKLNDYHDSKKVAEKLTQDNTLLDNSFENYDKLSKQIKMLYNNLK